MLMTSVYDIPVHNLLEVNLRAKIGFNTHADTHKLDVPDLTAILLSEEDIPLSIFLPRLKTSIVTNS